MTTPPPPAPEIRDATGRPIRTLAQAERDGWAAGQRSLGRSYRAIATDLDISVSTAYECVQRAFRATLAEPAEQARAVELARLEVMHDKAMEVLEGKHITVSHGKIVMLSGAPLPDDGPVLAAINTLVRVSESRRKLLGIDAPAQIEHTGGVRYEVVGIAPEDLV